MPSGVPHHYHFVVGHGPVEFPGRKVVVVCHWHAGFR